MKMYGIRQFLILLYKGLLLRKRHYIVTFFEIVIPVLVAVIPCIIQSETSSPYDSKYERHNKGLWVNYTTFDPIDPFKPRSSTMYALHFVYAPSNDITDKFMDDAIKYFKTKLEYRGNITRKSTNSESELESYCLYQQRKESGTIMIGTVFKDFDKKLPSSLDYKIRYNSEFYDSFYTKLKYRVSGEPAYMNAYTSTFFLSWQASVEQTFIQKKMEETGKNIDYKVMMQRFPYPEHRDTSQMFSVINIVPWVICYGYLIFIINIVRRVIEEKANGSKELLKMMGMTDSMYWTSTFMNYFIVGFITMLITAIVYKCPLKNGVVFLKHMDFTLLFILLLLFMAGLILFCLLFSVFFNRTVFAVIALLIVYILSFTLLMTNYFLLQTDLSYLPLSLGNKLGICLLPSGGLLTLFFMISFYEATGEGANWSNLTDFSLVPGLNMLMIIGMMFASCVIFIIAIWYFDAVWPWQPGVPKPFYFLFTKTYWCGTQPSDPDELKLVNKTENSTDFFEEEPSGVSPGVVINNLSKEFRTGLRSKLAVKDLSLNIYQGQITALLGHNGAGKTTTINILTGLYTPTKGSASINGLDILTETTKARRGLGVCPQHNVLFDTLTVEEHLKIYAAMKGVPWGNLLPEAVHVMNLLKLVDKRYELVKNLSGGMKRKLSLGIAIVGGSKVLFLDEPTSGMDVEARRSVWDALLEVRHERTVILTTHYMEEADILGDRIAIMAEGEVQCCGSPMFLKQKFGTGYHLHVVKDATFEAQGLTSLLKKFIPEVTVGNELEKEISFNLASNTGSGFGDMFEELENHKEELGVLSFGVTITTMEDVFLNVANISDIKYKLKPDDNMKNGARVEMEDVYGDSPGLKPYRKPLNQFFALIMKRVHYSKRHWGLVIAQLVIPFILICGYLRIVGGGGNQFRLDYDPLKLDINEVYGGTYGFYNQKPEFAALSNTFKQVLESNNIVVEKVTEPTHYVLKEGKEDISFFLRKLLVGGMIDRYSGGAWNLTAWYNGEPFHVTPMALLLMHTALLQNITNEGSISLTNAPLPESFLRVSSSGMSVIIGILAAVFVPLAFGIMSASFTLLPIHETESKAKLLQLMSGIPAVMYWTSMFLWDFLIHCVISILLIIPFAIFSHYAFFGKHSDAIGSTLLLMFLYGWASIPFSYLTSFLFKKGSVGFSVIVAFCAIIGVGVGCTLKALELTIGDISVRLQRAMWGFRIFPTFSLASGAANLFGLAYMNAFCDSIPAKDLKFNCYSPSMDVRNPLFKCCKNVCEQQGLCLEESPLLSMKAYGCGRDILFLLLDGFVYFGIILLLETSLFAHLFRIACHEFRKIKKSVVGQVVQDSIIEDSDVLQEEGRIHSLTATHMGSGGDALVVSQLTRVFKNFYAVNHLSFGIHQEECFGLLGVNGAGKTTTFRMLTGDCYPTEGNAFIQHSSLRNDLKKFQSYLGYCPQFDALIDRLTGRETLTLFGRLRGLSGSELEERVDKLIKMTDLTAHADKQSQFYSGGNKRKLSVGIALIGSPPLILLDEPTAGVDPVSRRKIWNILSQARNNTGAAVILTTHSMEESEALCSRLAIMVNGRFRCLGSIQQLKSKYGQGYTLIIKMKREDQDDQGAMSRIKNYIQDNLNGASLKDDHQGMLQYHVVDPSITLSRLFKFMSKMKVDFQLEDYLISDTSLEQIFLTFARAQRITA